MGAVLDAAVIVTVTALSGLIGGTQRYLADRAVARLHRRSAVTATALRDGQETDLPSGELVVGDVVTLGAGDVVPADCRLLTADGVEADESALTGESLPVAKGVAPYSPRTWPSAAPWSTRAPPWRRATPAPWSSSPARTPRRAAARGRQGAAPPVGVERRLARITRAALPVALGSAGAVMAAGLLRGRPARRTIGAAVGLAVASVPEGLPFLVVAAQLAAAAAVGPGRVRTRRAHHRGRGPHRRAVLRQDRHPHPGPAVAVRRIGGRPQRARRATGRGVPRGPGRRAARHPRRHGRRRFANVTDGAVLAGAESAG
ncbi:hypothetical protein NKH77_54310 [Streptomyces sp. M19]